jgi:Tfp pilus assembly protein PilO
MWSSMPRVPENTCFPPTSVRIVVLIVIVFAVVVLVWRGYGIAAALSAVAATAMLSEEILRRLTWSPRPDQA